MECVGLIAVSSAIIFARLAMMQELNPFFWGSLAVVIYVGAPGYMIYRGASWFDAPWVWLSSFGGLFLLFIAQTLIAERRRYQGRSAPKKKTRRGKRS